MSGLPAPLADKTGKLIPRLASDHDGEVVGTVAAIRRSLKSAGHDLHDLARALASPEIPFPDYPEPRHDPQGPSSRWWEPESPEPERADWRSLLTFCRERASLLNPREQQFVASLSRWRGRPTERQLDWLQSIYAKLIEWGV